MRERGGRPGSITPAATASFPAAFESPSTSFTAACCPLAAAESPAYSESATPRHATPHAHVESSLNGWHDMMWRTRFTRPFAEAKDVHHMCAIMGYGADAVCPYLAIDAIARLREDNLVPNAPGRG